MKILLVLKNIIVRPNHFLKFHCEGEAVSLVLPICITSCLEMTTPKNTKAKTNHFLERHTRT